MDTDHPHKEKRPPRMRTINVVSLVVAIVLTASSLVIMSQVMGAHALANRTNQTYEQCVRATDDLQEASDFLTEQSRQYVDSSDRAFLDAYLDELEDRDRRGRALSTLRAATTDERAVDALAEAAQRSDELAQTELYAMRLVAGAHGTVELPEALASVQLSASDEALGAVERRARSHTMLTGDAYGQLKLLIGEKVQECSAILLADLRADLEQSNARLNTLMMALVISTVLLLLMVVFVTVASSTLVLWPMALHERSIREDEPLEPRGSAELRYLAEAYNDMYAHGHERADRLRQRARTDPLTGALNRGAYEKLLEQHVRGDMALVLVDVDHFKRFNDAYGHDMGDAVLIEVAATLFDSFRASDHVCRIGGDEFAVIMAGANATMQDAVSRKLERVAEFLREDDNGIPPVTLSVGVAFADRSPGGADALFKAADQALYQVKRDGRDGRAFAG